jgi:hypothetical protein
MKRAGIEIDMSMKLTIIDNETSSLYNILSTLTDVEICFFQIPPRVAIRSRFQHRYYVQRGQTDLSAIPLQAVVAPLHPDLHPVHLQLVRPPPVDDTHWLGAVAPRYRLKHAVSATRRRQLQLLEEMATHASSEPMRERQMLMLAAEQTGLVTSESYGSSPLSPAMMAQPGDFDLSTFASSDKSAKSNLSDLSAMSDFVD